jgi:hypothetical protein
VALPLTLESSFSTYVRNVAIAASIPVLLFADGGAFLLGMALFGDVFMRR